MNGPLTSVDQEETQEREGISLWNLHRDLTRLADELAGAARRADTGAEHDAHELSQASTSPTAPRDYFETLLTQRRERERCLGNELFSEPAWDIMLELMIARIDGREMRISELSASQENSGKFSSSYVDALVEAMLIERYECFEGSKDCFLSLSSEAARRMAELYRARMRG
ncbi:hypothetical protein SZ64_05855 [Erythrobacter sp. SG61-1L]|nr:hypothetical protein SZ64_05855 [Erythrobacter sp. SG61-1L]